MPQCQSEIHSGEVVFTNKVKCPACELAELREKVAEVVAAWDTYEDDYGGKQEERCSKAIDALREGE